MPTNPEHRRQNPRWEPFAPKTYYRLFDQLNIVMDEGYANLGFGGWNPYNPSASDINKLANAMYANFTRDMEDVMAWAATEQTDLSEESPWLLTEESNLWIPMHISNMSFTAQMRIQIANLPTTTRGAFIPALESISIFQGIEVAKIGNLGAYIEMVAYDNGETRVLGYNDESTLHTGFCPPQDTLFDRAANAALDKWFE